MKPAIRRPILGVAFLFLAGTLYGLFIDIAMGVLFCAAFAVLLVAFSFRGKFPGNMALGALMFLVGWINAALCVYSPSGRELSAQMNRAREHAEVIAVVVNDPVREAGRVKGEESRHFRGRVEGVRREGCWVHANGTVDAWWRTSSDTPVIQYGDRRILRGVLQQRPGFGYRRYRMNVVSMGPNLPVGFGTGKWLAKCFDARRLCAGRLANGMEAYPETVALTRALLLGFREELPDELKHLFSLTGTLHVVAISGLHVGILSMLIVTLLQALGIGRQRWILYLFPALVVYVFVTGMHPSALRAGVMAVIFWSAPFFQRKSDGPSALGAAAIVIVAIAPTQLVDLGFLFSFAAVGGLMLFYSRLLMPLRPLYAGDPLRLQPDPFWVKKARKAVEYFVGVAVTSVAVWVMTAPLSARIFHQVSPGSLLGNLLVIPLTCVVLFTGILSIIFGSMAGVLGEVFNHANHVFVVIMTEWVRWISKLPGSHYAIGDFSNFWIVIWYGLLLGALVARGFLRRLVFPAALCVVAVVAFLYLADRRVRVEIFDVGQGGAALIDVPGSGDVLVDAGPKFKADRLVRKLRRLGVDHLRAIVLTHADTDYAGGALAVMNKFPVEELWCSPWLRRSPVCREALHFAGEHGIRIRRLGAYESGVLDGGVVWEVFNPSGAKICRRSDEGSLVLRFALNGSSVLFMNGAAGVAESRLARAPIDPAAAVLVVGDHGAAGTCSAAWLDAVRPAYAVVSVGVGNFEDDPDKDVLMRLRQRRTYIWRTDETGDILILFNEGSKLPDVAAD